MGICFTSKPLLGGQILVSKSLATVGLDHMVPVKVLNATEDHITLYKHTTLSQFEVIDDSYDILPISSGATVDQIENCQHVTTNFTPDCEYRANKPVSMDRDNFLSLLTLICLHLFSLHRRSRSWKISMRLKTCL